MINNELQVILDEQKVAKENTDALIKAFGAPFTEAGKILSTYKKIVVTDESQTDIMKIAKEKRITLKNIRTGVENKRKELKEDSLRTGKAIDAVAKYIKENIEPAEEYLELQEKFVEIKQTERAAKVKLERTERLLKYTDDISMYNIDGIEDETFEFLLTKVKKEYDDKIATEKAESERLAKEEKERIAEQERIVKENARLRKEAEQKEVELAVERKKEADKQAKIEAEHEKQLLAERAKLATIEADQRKKDEVIAKEKADKEAAEAKALADAKEAEMKALLSPDKDKLIQLANGLDIVRRDKLPALKTKKAQDIIIQVELHLSQLYNYIMDEVKEL